ncbi:hypothetical protein [Paraclostridium tenue]|uniref:Uncharacterized protein n=1 Tax=Paraclostridium tenue TaxID=1737 RepID=A0ABN1MB78_9FIRM
MKQIINFIMSDKGYITVVFVILVIAFFISKKNLYDEKDKGGSSLKITLTMFILLMVGVAGYIISFGTNITDANKLSTIASFTAPFIAFSGAYLIFEFGQKKADREKEIDNDKKLEHKKKMLFTLLEFSYIQTRIPSENIKQVYKDDYKKIPCEGKGFAVNKYKLTGEIMTDFDKMLRVKPCKDTEYFDDFLDWVSDKLVEDMKDTNIYKRVIYIENWYDYLDCIDNAEDINSIVFWITMIKSSNNSIKVYQFLSNRDNIDSLIKKYYPKVIDEGLRGKLRKVDL